MNEDPVVGLKSRLSVIRAALDKAEHPSEAMLELERYYLQQIAVWERKALKRKKNPA